MKLRIRWGKKGSVKFIGHLDIMRFFQKAFRRAGFDLTYSQGYHPHPVLSFAAPLGVGMESSGEYMDLEVNSITDTGQMLRRLNGQMAEGITIYDIHVLKDEAKNAMSLVAAADYEVRFREGFAPCSPLQLQENISRFLAEDEIRILKKTKRSQMEMNIRPLIYDLHLLEDGAVFMQISSGSAANLRPDLLMKTLIEKSGLTFDPMMLMITRRDMYADAGPEGERLLVSLGQYERAGA